VAVACLNDAVSFGVQFATFRKMIVA